VQDLALSNVKKKPTAPEDQKKKKKTKTKTNKQTNFGNIDQPSQHILYPQTERNNHNLSKTVALPEPDSE
jgi:hypothetical protein